MALAPPSALLLYSNFDRHNFIIHHLFSPFLSYRLILNNGNKVSIWGSWWYHKYLLLFCEWNPDRLALVGRVVTRWAWLRWVHRGERFPDAVRGFADRRCWMIYRQMRVIIVSGKLIDTDVCFDFSKRTCSHSVRHRTATGYLGTQGIKRTGRHHSVDVPQLHLKPKPCYLCVIHW